MPEAAAVAAADAPASPEANRPRFIFGFFIKTNKPQFKTHKS
jgi:hypothetical protein